MEHSLSDNKF